jgi:hypothetical protein
MVILYNLDQATKTTKNVAFAMAANPFQLAPAFGFKRVGLDITSMNCPAGH